jgi:hypothetical protein
MIIIQDLRLQIFIQQEEKEKKVNNPRKNYDILID